jgi:MoaA/NifB/PqqE/SkfB family radical SAM enzyme
MFIKSEILLTRHCSVGCSYCAIRRKTPDLPLLKWKKVLEQLKKWDVRFLAIYGAEPTEYVDFYGFLRLVKDLGWGKSSTVITAGNHLAVLAGAVSLGLLDSITVSWDFEKTHKNDWALSVIQMFRDQVSDLELSLTIFEDTTVEDLAKVFNICEMYNVWISFDLKHQNPTRHQWSKVPFGRDRVVYNDAVIQYILERKRSGAKVHQTEAAIMLDLSFEPLWVCKEPYFISINSDGHPMVCDDFHRMDKPVYEMTEAEFRTEWHESVAGCQGCKWSTHFLSEEIFSEEGVRHFAHGRE